MRRKTPRAHYRACKCGTRAPVKDARLACIQPRCVSSSGAGKAEGCLMSTSATAPFQRAAGSPGS